MVYDSTDTSTGLFRQQYEAERLARLKAEEALRLCHEGLDRQAAQIHQLQEDFDTRLEAATLRMRGDRDEALEQLRIKSELLANVSHEIRTPLNGVLGMLYSLRKCKSDIQRVSLVDSAIESGKLLISVINDLLDFSKNEIAGIVLDEIEYDPRQMLETVVHLFAANARSKGLDIIADLDPALPLVIRGDWFRLQQVLGNLISNAIKFTDAGRVQINAHMVSANRVEISVLDTGIGMAPEHMETIFSPFVQADSSVTRHYGGTGLGLAICKQILAAMNSRLEVSSQLDIGTRFTFALDLAVVDGSTLADVVGDRLHNRTVVLLSRSAIYNAKLSKMLVGLGVSRYCWADNVGAVAAYLETAKTASVIIDASHLRRDDLEAWRLFQESRPELGVIVLEDYEDMKPVDSQTAVHLLKPVRARALVSALIEPASVTPRQHNDPDSGLPPAAEGISVLVVDDNDINLKVAGAILTDAGCLVRVVNSGRSALHIVQEQEFDLIFMDIQMPDMDGLATTRAIRALGGRFGELPIVAMTAHALEEDINKQRAAGMNGHVSKPVEPGYMLGELLRLTRGAQAQKPASDTPAAAGINPELAESRPEPAVGSTSQACPALDAGEDVAVQLPQLEGCDFTAVTRNLGGNTELVLSLLHQFVEEYEDTYSRILQWLAVDNLEEVKVITHSIKGSGSNLGLMALAKAASEIEHRLKCGQMLTDHELAPLQQELQKLPLLKQSPETAPLSAIPDSASADTRNERLRELLDHIEEQLFRDVLTARQEVASLLATPMPDHLKVMADHIDQCLTLYDARGAARWVGDMRDAIGAGTTAG